MASKVQIDFVQKGSQAVVSAWDAQNQAILANTTALRSHDKQADTHVKALRRRREAAKAESAAQKAAAKILADTQTPQQKYLSLVSKIKAQHEAGRITQAQLQQGIKKYQTDLQKLTGTEAKRAAELKKAESKRAEMMRQAASVLQQTQTPQQAYNESVRQAEHLARSGAITQQQLNQAVGRYDAQLRRANGSEEAHNKQMRAAKAITERNITPLQRYDREVAELTQHLNAGRISQRVYNAELAKSGRAFKEADTNAKRLDSNRFSRVNNSVRSVAAGIFGGYGVLQGLRFWINSNEKLIKQSDTLKTKYDTIGTRFAVQSGIPEFQEETATNKILDIAEARRVPVQQVGAAATQLVSSGFDAKEVLDGALNEFVRGLNASNLVRPDLDPTALAKAVGQYLASQGLEKNTKNLTRVLEQVQQLFKTTDVQVSDLEDFAKVASGLKGKLSIEEQLATFSVLRETEGGAGEASTLLRNIAGRTQIIGASDAKTAALAELGLKPQDVDLIGESITEVLERYAAAIKQTDEAKIRPALTKLFEERAVPGILNLTGERDGAPTTDLIKARVASQADTSGFGRDADRQERSRQAVITNQEIRQNRALANQYGRDLDLLISEMRIFLTERKAAPASIEAAEKALTTTVAGGGSNRTGLSVGLTAAGFTTDESINEVLNQLRIAQRRKGFDKAIDQVPGIRGTGDNRRNVEIQQTQGFNPEARTERARQEFVRALDAMGVSRNPSVFGAIKSGPNAQFNRQIRDNQFDLPVGGIEAKTAELIKQYQAINGSDAEGVRQALEALAKFGNVARADQQEPIPSVGRGVSTSLAGQETANNTRQSLDVQNETLDVLRNIKSELQTNDRPQATAPAPSPTRRQPRIAPLSKKGRS